MPPSLATKMVAATFADRRLEEENNISCRSALEFLDLEIIAPQEQEKLAFGFPRVIVNNNPNGSVYFGWLI
jgi:hypothetical protein